MHQQVAEGSADLHSSHHLLALLVQQQQAMPLVVQLSNQALLEDLSRVQALEEDLGALGLLLAALPQLNLLHSRTLPCGPCADDFTVTSVHQKYVIDHKRHRACNCTASKSYVHSLSSKRIVSFKVVQAY